MGLDCVAMLVRTQAIVARVAVLVGLPGRAARIAVQAVKNDIRPKAYPDMREFFYRSVPNTKAMGGEAKI
jgi:hypothetical protein